MLQNHLQQLPENHEGHMLQRDETASPAIPVEEDYSVVLPERLTPNGPWHVHRYEPDLGLCGVWSCSGNRADVDGMMCQVSTFTRGACFTLSTSD
jgi:hypothetical protein